MIRKVTLLWFSAIFAGMSLKLKNADPTFSSFSPCPWLRSVTTDDGKQFQCINIVLNVTILDHFFWNSSDSMQLAYTAKFYLSIVYDLSWDECNTLEKLERLVSSNNSRAPFFSHKKGATIPGKRLFQIVLTGSRAHNISFYFPIKSTNNHIK